MDNLNAKKSLLHWLWIKITVSQKQFLRKEQSSSSLSSPHCRSLPNLDHYSDYGHEAANNFFILERAKCSTKTTSWLDKTKFGSEITKKGWTLDWVKKETYYSNVKKTSLPKWSQCVSWLWDGPKRKVRFTQGR